MVLITAYNGGQDKIIGLLSARGFA